MEQYKPTDLNKVKRGANRAIYDVNTINAILDVSFIAYVSYVYEGKAISLPMAYARIDNKIYIHGSLKNRMLLALLDAGEASATVMILDGLVLARSGLHHSVNYRSVTLFTKAKQIDDPEEKTMLLKRIVDHMVPNRWDNLRPMKEKELNGTLVVELEIESASAKVRAEGVLDEKSDMHLPIWAGVIPIRQVAEYPQSDAFLPEDVPIPTHIQDYYEKEKY